MKISVIGTGYVGLVSGTCFAEMGHDVTCIDIDAKKIANLKEGIIPIYEQALEGMVKKNIQDQRLHFSTEYNSITESSAIFMAVGTPPKDDGSADLTYLFSALDSVMPVLKENSAIVIKSTVPVGTHKIVHDYLKEKTNKPFHIVNNPEFLKEGSAVHDFMKADRIIIGFEGETPEKIMEELYRPFTRKGMPLIKMSNLSAEMTKYAANCYLATRISFINEIARLCDLTGADIAEVRTGMGSDKRIGKYFLYPGPGYGGSCFPKDVQALLKTARSYDLDLEIINAAEKVNHDQKTYMVDKIKRHFLGNLSGKTIALWGTAFKANTDDIRQSPAINTTEELLSLGAKVRYYDSVAADNFEAFIKEKNLIATRYNDKYEMLKDADGVITMTEWQEFTTPDLKKMKSLLKSPNIFDARNLFDAREVQSLGFNYYAIGKKV